MVRSASLLALLLVLAVGSCSNGSGEMFGRGVQGSILAGPQCPVERVDSPCPDRPTQGVVVVLDANGEPVATTTSDPRGSFAVSPLDPGTYSVFAHEIGDNPRISKQISVTVPEAGFVTVTLVIDTGIR